MSAEGRGTVTCRTRLGARYDEPSTSLGRQDLVDLRLPQQKSSLVQLLATHPAGHLGIALTGVAGTTTGHDVGKLVSSAARYGQHAILLQWRTHRPAVRASAPRHFQCVPLRIGEVVNLRGDAPPATAGVPDCARWPSSRHGSSLSRAYSFFAAERRVYQAGWCRVHSAMVFPESCRFTGALSSTLEVVRGRRSEICGSASANSITARYPAR